MICIFAEENYLLSSAFKLERQSSVSSRTSGFQSGNPGANPGCRIFTLYPDIEVTIHQKMSFVAGFTTNFDTY